MSEMILIGIGAFTIILCLIILVTTLSITPAGECVNNNTNIYTNQTSYDTNTYYTNYTNLTSVYYQNASFNDYSYNFYNSTCSNLTTIVNNTVYVYQNNQTNTTELRNIYLYNVTLINATIFNSSIINSTIVNSTIT